MSNFKNNLVLAERIVRARKLKRKEELIASGKLKIRTISKKERVRFARIRAERMQIDYYREPGRKPTPPVDLYVRDLDLLRIQDKVPGLEIAA